MSLKRLFTPSIFIPTTFYPATFRVSVNVKVRVRVRVGVRVSYSWENTITIYTLEPLSRTCIDNLVGVQPQGKKS